MIKPLELDNIPEPRLVYNPLSRRYIFENPENEGRLACERNVEVPWINDKLSQAFKKRLILHKLKLFDFGCNKAQYLLDAKKIYKVKIFGIDMKSQAKNFVCKFFHSEFNQKVAEKIRSYAPFDVCTAISSIEHAGYKYHPNKEWIWEYHMEIIRFLIDTSRVCFISAPFGQRPGWASDGSRKNFYQFNVPMLSAIEKYSRYRNKNFLNEIYRYVDQGPSGVWVKSNIESTKNSFYRKNKSGASAVTLMSVWSE